MTITRKKIPDKKEIHVSKAAGDSIEKDLAKKAVAKKKATKKANVKKVTKSAKVTKKSTVKGKKQSNGQTKKKTTVKNDKKSTDDKTEKTGLGEKNIEDIVNEYPTWFVELFQYLDKLEEISVLSQEEGKEDDPKKRVTSYAAREMERKLFLIFMSSPKKVWDKEDGVYFRLLQKDFSEQAQISQNSLSEWKNQNWFKDNHATVMKEIFKARTPDILDSLYEGATTKVNEWGKRDAAAIKLWLEYIEGFKPGVDVTTGGEKVEVYFGNGNVGQSQFINKNKPKKGESSK